MRTQLTAAMLALAALSATPFANAQEVQKKLAKDFAIDRKVQAPFENIIDFVSDLMEAPIVIELSEFKAHNRKVPTDVLITLPKLTVSADSIIREVLSRVNCVYEVRDQRIVIVPNVFNGKPRRFPLLSQSDEDRVQKTKLTLRNKKVDIERDIRATLTDVIEFFTDRSGIPISIDDNAFRAIDCNTVSDIVVELTKSEHVPLKTILNALIKQIKGRYEVMPGYIRIVPSSGKS